MEMKLRGQNGRISEKINMGKERKLTEGGFEDIFPEVTELLLTDENPDTIAIAAGLSKKQWDCISFYLDNPNFYDISEQLEVKRSNIYPILSQGFAKLERWRRR